MMLPLVILSIEDPGKRAKYSDAYIRLRDHLIAVAVSILNDAALAEDALQDAFESIIKADALPSDPFGQKALLTTVVRRKALDMLKHMKRLADEEPSEEKISVEDNSKQLELDMLIEKLPCIYREVLVMHYESDMTTKQISEVLDISRPAVLKRLERARELLRKEYFEE